MTNKKQWFPATDIEMFSPNTFEFRWNDDFSEFQALALRWTDDASYVRYQNGSYAHEQAMLRGEY